MTLMAFLRAMPAEERANALIHGLGAALSALVGASLITLAARGGDAWQIVSAAVFSAALLVLYVASTMYHAVQHRQTKGRLEIVDHAAIFVLIAGTYTPFTLISLRGAWGWALFGVIWALALIGVVAKLFLTGRFSRLSTLIYLLMGWLVVAVVPMTQALPLATLLWLLAGGLAYSLGTIFYHNERLPYAHAIWHLFVLAGSACHVVAVATQVLPA
jgi:hemolysin III